MQIDLSRNPDEMTPQDRIAIINDARSRILARETLSDEELRYAIRLMQSERKLSSSRSGTAKSKKAPAPAPSQLSDF